MAMRLALTHSVLDVHIFCLRDPHYHRKSGGPAMLCHCPSPYCICAWTVNGASESGVGHVCPSPQDNLQGLGRMEKGFAEMAVLILTLVLILTFTVLNVYWLSIITSIETLFRANPWRHRLRLLLIPKNIFFIEKDASRCDDFVGFRQPYFPQLGCGITDLPSMTRSRSQLSPTGTCLS